MLAAAPTANATQPAQRRQRRLRQFLQHELLTVAMLCAGRTHPPAGALQPPRRKARRDAARPSLRRKAAGAGPATHRGTDRRQCAVLAVSRCSCAADGRTAGGRPPFDTQLWDSWRRFSPSSTPRCLLSSRLSTCPRSSSRKSRSESRLASRNWRKGRWKCQQSSTSSSRPLAFQFRVVVGVVFKAFF